MATENHKFDSQVLHKTWTAEKRGGGKHLTANVCINDLDNLNLFSRLISGFSQVLLHPQLPQKILLVSNVVKSDSKTILLLFLPVLSLNS